MSGAFETELEKEGNPCHDSVWSLFPDQERVKKNNFYWPCLKALWKQTVLHGWLCSLWGLQNHSGCVKVSRSDRLSSGQRLMSLVLRGAWISWVQHQKSSLSTLSLPLSLYFYHPCLNSRHLKEGGRCSFWVDMTGHNNERASGEQQGPLKGQVTATQYHTLISMQSLSHAQIMYLASPIIPCCMGRYICSVTHLFVSSCVWRSGF